MGMDISGKNPKINVSTTEFPMLEKWENKTWPEREKSKDWEKEQKQCMVVETIMELLCFYRRLLS